MGAVALIAALAAGVTMWVTNDRMKGGCRGGTENLVIASAEFPESQVIAHIYAHALRANGFNVDTKLGIGGRDAYIPAVRQCSASLVPDFTGNLLQYLDPTVTAGSPEQIAKALPAALGDTLVTGAPAAASDGDSLVVTRATAEKWRLRSIADLVAHAAEIKLAGSPEFGDRPGGLPTLANAYGLTIQPEAFVPVSYDGTGKAVVQALTSGQATVATLSSSSALIKQHDLVVLADPRNMFPAQQVIPVWNVHKSSDKAIRVLDAVSRKLTTEDLQTLNKLITGDHKKAVSDAAEAWVSGHGLDEKID